MRSIVVCAAIVAGLAAGSMVHAPPGFATHAGVVCGASNGTYSNNSEVFLPLKWINWSFWSSGKDYIARRYNSDILVTYQQYVVGPAQHQTTSSDGNEVFRTTSIQRAGYTSTDYGESEWAHASCT